MKRLPIFFPLLLGSILFLGADGCSSDPNVEGAKLDLRNKDYDRAIENLDTALSKNPDNAEALELKGRVLSEKAFKTTDIAEHSNLIAGMIEAFNRAKAVDPTLAEQITQSMRFAFASEFQMGVQAFNRGRDDESEYGTAVTHFDNASLIQPDSASAYINKAYALMNGGRVEDAIEPFEKALEKGDTDVETFTLLARLYQTNDRTEDAVKLLEKASELYPDNVDVQTELLNSYQLAGQIDRAMEVYADAVKSDPDNKLYRYNYGSLLVQVERYDDAIEQLKAAVALDPEYANAQYNLGAAFINKAVAVNDRIDVVDDSLRANRDSMSDAERKAGDDELYRLADERKALFAEAIAPLEAAKSLFDEAGDDASGVCRALYQSYVQVNRLDDAQSVSACAGYDDESEN